MKPNRQPSMYERIYSVINRIPAGKVTTYGQVAHMAGGCSPRNVGYALSALPENLDIPWHRVINRLGRISLRSDLGGDQIQRQLLELEGVMFSDSEQVDLERFGWIPEAESDL